MGLIKFILCLFYVKKGKPPLLPNNINIHLLYYCIYTTGKTPIRPQFIEYELKITRRKVKDAFTLLALCVTRLKAIAPADPRVRPHATCTNTAENWKPFQTSVRNHWCISVSSNLKWCHLLCGSNQYWQCITNCQLLQGCVREIYSDCPHNGLLLPFVSYNHNCVFV